MEKIVKYTIIQVVLIVVAILALVSCKSVKVVEKVNYRDSVVVTYHNDTTHVEVFDTTHVEIHSSKTTENGTEIIFGEGGGTYNSKTGEATNVVGVKEQASSHEQSDLVADLSSRITMLQASNDSLSSAVSHYQHEYEEERKNTRSGYDRFCSCWFWITAILLLIKIAAWVMEKIPATAPYVIIARKFVPFL